MLERYFYLQKKKLHGWVSAQVWWVIRSIPHGAPIGLFLIPASAPHPVSKIVVGAILSGMVHIKDTVVNCYILYASQFCNKRTLSSN